VIDRLVPTSGGRPDGCQEEEHQEDREEGREEEGREAEEEIGIA
jgi:hypothetical protein